MVSVAMLVMAEVLLSVGLVHISLGKDLMQWLPVPVRCVPLVGHVVCCIVPSLEYRFPVVYPLYHDCIHRSVVVGDEYTLVVVPIVEELAPVGSIP